MIWRSREAAPKNYRDKRHWNGSIVRVEQCCCEQNAGVLRCAQNDNIIFTVIAFTVIQESAFGNSV
jgi:hypothetical protein